MTIHYFQDHRFGSVLILADNKKATKVSVWVDGEEVARKVFSGDDAVGDAMDFGSDLADELGNEFFMPTAESIAINHAIPESDW